MRTRMRVGCFKLTLKTIDRLVKVVFPPIRNPKEEIDLRISRVVDQYMLEQLNGIVKSKFRLLQNSQALQGLKAFRSKRQGLFVDPLRSGVVPGLFFSACFFEQGLHVALRLSCPGRCRGDRAESSEQQVIRNPAQCAMPTEGWPDKFLSFTLCQILKITNLLQKYSKQHQTRFRKDRTLRTQPPISACDLPV